MKTVLKLEELAMALACLGGLMINDVAWWWYILFLLGPDISFLGYLFGNKIGAIVYNVFHHKGIALAILAFSFWLPDLTADQGKVSAIYTCIGLVLLGHSSMDRFFGYGLKHLEGFKFTHLGQIGKS